MKKNVYALKLWLGCALFGVILLTGQAQAQQLGIANSNYAGTNSLYTNPSAIADSRHKFYFHLVSAEFNATNNYLRYDAPKSLFKLALDGDAFETSYIQENLNGKPKLISAGADLRGPALMVRLNDKNSFAFSTRVRGAVQANNLSEEVARLYKINEEGDADFLNRRYPNNTLNLNANVFSEMAFSYARVVMDQGPHFVKAGITLKKLNGASAAYLNLDDTDLETREIAGPDPEDTDYLVKFDRVNARYGYAEIPDFDAADTGDLLSLLFGGKSAGSGWGTDLGLTYEYRPDSDNFTMARNGESVPDREQHKYRYRVAVALMDIGGINYSNPDMVWAYDVSRTNKEIRLSELEGVESTDEIIDYLNQQLDVSSIEKKTSFRSTLPTALHINVDYRFTRNLYANATLMHGLRGKNATGMRHNSLFAITPRAEFRKFEVAFPLALQNNYSIMTVGAMVRFMNFYIGSDNIGGAINLGKPYGANAYVGISLLPILQRNAKDKTPKAVPAN